MSPLAHIPLPLRIRILYEDDDIVVVVKPPHLRTVPGNAEQPQSPPQSPPQPKYSASQAWKHVVVHYATTITQPPDEIDTFLCHISQVEHYAKCLPHKWKPFQSFVKRNWSNYGASTFVTEQDITKLLPRIFQRLTTAQRKLLPASTTHEESVLGQLCLLYPTTTTTTTATTHWYIVHRLDCETSGVLVVGRTSRAAAALCRAWRERSSVQKVYWAKVHRLPDDVTEEWQTIHDALKPSTTERLKWEISNDADAKECTTLWRRRRRRRVADDDDDDDSLELKPVTGRTHQLRVHCEAHFGGIVGDALYGRQSSEEDRLYLHAYQLSFPHPRTQEQVTFVHDPEW